MQNERYPQDLAVSLHDFMASGWKESIAQATREGYSAMWQAMSVAARSAIEQGRVEHGKVLWLLADVCSMMLSPLSPNEPFKPFVAHNCRSVIPDDLTDAEINFFAEIVDAVDDNLLKARLSDLVWLKGKPRNTEFALKAIDAYRRLPLDTDMWMHGCRECWPRAISLARMLKGGAGDRLQQMEVTIVTAFEAAKREDGFLGLWLADLLKSNGLGRAHRIDLARRLEELAREIDVEGDLHRAREYFSAAAEWFRAIPDEAKAAEMTMAVAEGWVKEAVARTASKNPSHMVASSFYQNAIQTYRTIPRTQRSVHRVDERIGELHALLTVSGERATDEMMRIKTPSVDITELVENARKAVAGKSAQNALLAFANLHRGANTEEIRINVLNKMRQHSFQSVFSSTMISRDGRVIAKRPAINLSADLTSDDERAIRAEMVRDYGILVSLVVQGEIWPALEVLLLEHRLVEVDFVALARNSPIVPKDRAGLFGKALFAGYERDFVTALHLLIPQLENMVRLHLKQVGAKTANIYKAGIQNENGMSTLLELPEAAQVFGNDLAFELNALFCDAFGPNLRNELAHGLLDEDGCNSPYAIYAWWLTLRLTMNSWWNSAKPAAKQQESPIQQE